MAVEEENLGGYELFVLMGLAFRNFIDDLQSKIALAGFEDIRPGHGFAFQLLSFKNASVNELAEHLGVTKQAASQMVEYLENHDYVTSLPDPKDRRIKVVALTARGWACIRKTEEILGEQERALAAELGPARVAELRGLLRQVVYRQQGDRQPLRLRPIW